MVTVYMLQHARIKVSFYQLTSIWHEGIQKLMCTPVVSTDSGNLQWGRELPLQHQLHRLCHRSCGQWECCNGSGPHSHQTWWKRLQLCPEPARVQYELIHQSQVQVPVVIKDKLPVFTCDILIVYNVFYIMRCKSIILCMYVPKNSVSKKRKTLNLSCDISGTSFFFKNSTSASKKTWNFITHNYWLSRRNDSRQKFFE